MPDETDSEVKQARADLNSPVQNCRKFSAVFGTTSANSCRTELCERSIAVSRVVGVTTDCSRKRGVCASAALTSMTMRPALLPPRLMSKKTMGLEGLPAAACARGTPGELLNDTDGDRSAICAERDWAAK